jgi:protein SCO1/2
MDKGEFSAGRPSSTRMTLPLGFMVVLTFFTVTVVALWYLRAGVGGAGAAAPSKLTPIKDAPAFTLKDQTGRSVTRDDLLGFVWVADFIFTSCTGPCPELTLRMRSLQQGIEKFADKVKLVSLSVDPEFDRPAVLRSYAERHHAKSDLWWFLTCDSEQEMHQIVREGFLQALSPAGQGTPIIHSTRFVLVDKRGRIRGWYDGLDPESKPAILRDVQQLLDESADP